MPGLDADVICLDVLRSHPIALGDVDDFLNVAVISSFRNAQLPMETFHA